MNTWMLSAKHCGMKISLIAVLMTSVIAAQMISIKTVPVATGDQFLLLPSENMGLGGLSISLEDALMDPWVNPALGSLIQGIHVRTSPVYYRVGNGYGDARSMPISMVWQQNGWYGGVAISLQAMSLADNQTFWNPEIRTLSGNMSENKYFSGFLGRRLGGSNFGIGFSKADLSALDGVDLLYANSQRIEQDGYIKDLRFGWQRSLPQGATLEAIAMYNELDMLHEVTYQLWGWEWAEEQVEKNLDHTITYGLKLRHTAPLKETGWRYGSILVANLKSHPKIPNYEIMNIPRDPGTTHAYNLGLGISKRDEAGTFGIDLIYEPIKSNTWAVTDTHLVTADEELLRPGDKTIENDFKFENWVLRTGLGWFTEKRGIQLGVQMRNIHYWLDQEDYVAAIQRDQEEYWVEWTTTWGITQNFDGFTLRYSGRTTMGTGRPGVDTPWFRFGLFEDASASGDFIIAPSDDLTLQEARVITHQISISLPIGD